MQCLLPSIDHGGNSEWAHRFAVRLRDVNTSQGLRLITPTLQCMYCLCFLLWCVPNFLVHTWSFLAIVPQGSLKTGQSGSLQNRTTVKARDIDVDGGPYRLCRHEQCLERRKETTSHRTGKARMVFTKDRARNRCTA